MYKTFCLIIRQKLQPTVATFTLKNYAANKAAKPIPSISAAAISIAVEFFLKLLADVQSRPLLNHRFYQFPNQLRLRSILLQRNLNLP